MIIERAIVESFGSFRGRNEIDLDPKGKQNVTLFIGHGGAGKTTIGKAIRWALYNRPFHESGKKEEDQEYSKEEILKLFFREGGGANDNRPPTANRMAVQLELRPSESVKSALLAHGYKFGKYLLERSASVGKVAPTPRDVIQTDLSLKGPDQRDVQDPEGIIEEFFLPASTSTFFMFHGDRIRDLTKQIDEPVVDDIKQILDVTAMNNATTDLGRIMSQLSRRVTSASKDESTRETKQHNLERFGKELQRLEKLCEDKRGQLGTVNSKLSKLGKENRELLEAAGLLERHEGIQKQKKLLEDDRDAIEENIQSTKDQFAPEALYHILYQKAFTTREVDRANSQHKERIEELQNKKDQLEQLKPGEECPVCKQRFPERMIEERQKEIQDIESDMRAEKQAIKPLDPEYIELMKTVIRLEVIKYSPEELEARRYRVRANITDLENELREVRQKLGDYNEPNVRARADTISEDLARLNTEKGRLLESIGKLEEDLERYKKAVNQLEKDLVILGGERSKKVREQFELAEKLGSVFMDAVIQLADQKRGEIAEKTGKMLMETTIKPELFHKTAPVEVDENFQIRAMNYNGNPLEWDVESSSERSLLSLSFIYGLLSAAEKEAPVILDTFFGNMDPNHISNIMGQLANFGSQIVLMATLTEFDDLVRRQSSPFWEHVNRYIFLRNNANTDFVTEIKTIYDLKQAETEAMMQEAELQRGKKFS